jgi:hypothetical protein
MQDVSLRQNPHKGVTVHHRDGSDVLPLHDAGSGADAGIHWTGDGGAGHQAPDLHVITSSGDSNLNQSAIEDQGRKSLGLGTAGRAFGHSAPGILALPRRLVSALRFVEVERDFEKEADK